MFASRHLVRGRTLGSYAIADGSTLFGLMRVLGGLEADPAAPAERKILSLKQARAEGGSTLPGTIARAIHDA